MKKLKKSLKNFKIFDTKIIVSDDLPALSALKKGKDSSMWKSIESQNSLDVDVSFLQEILVSCWLCQK